MTLVPLVKLPTVAFLLQATATLTATMFMTNRMKITTCTRTDRTRIPILSDGASLHNPVIPHLILSLPKFLLPPLNRP